MARKKRFTRWRDDYRIICPKHMQRDYKGDFTGPAVAQLAAYEDTELTPAQVVALQKEALALQTELDMMTVQMEELELKLTNARSEREYFRSRAEFFREMAGVPVGFVGGKV
jgi:hypothetical protein